MINTRKMLAVILTATLLSAMMSTILLQSVAAQESGDSQDATVSTSGTWLKIQTDFITVLFPANGRKPMFLWWYTNNSDNIFVVKFRGLVEYMTLTEPYYMHRFQADNLTMLTELQSMYGSMGMRMMNHMDAATMIRNYLFMHSFHPAFLPFSASQWNLTGPENVTRPDGVSYIAFNFTLMQAPLRFSFANGSVIIRARFYTTDATESAHNLYNYTVHKGELKMDLIVKDWDWNIDKLTTLFNQLHEEYGITIPSMRAGLALWTDLASINVTQIPLAQSDANSTSDLLEGDSNPCDMISGNMRIRVQENKTATTDEVPLRPSMPNRFRLRFANGSQTFAGFFDFVDNALLIDKTTGNITRVPVTGAYISAGAHLRLFIGYPYFGNKTLEHDPSIGLENVPTWMPITLILVLIGGTAAIGAAVIAVRVRKKTVNVLNVK